MVVLYVYVEAKIAFKYYTSKYQNNSIIKGLMFNCYQILALNVDYMINYNIINKV